eukprot:scaffold146589_cov44-Prasinocladus_malaysianus.AAC.1
MERGLVGRSVAHGPLIAVIHAVAVVAIACVYRYGPKVTPDPNTLHLNILAWKLLCTHEVLQPIRR